MPDSITHSNPNLYVITGGPGTGKTTVLRELQQRGFAVAEEVARQIIREQIDSGGTAVPWGDTREYTNLMLARSVESFLSLKADSVPTFCDRGIPDTLCYARIIQLAETDRISSACETFRYNPTVFMLPPWPEIYTTDSERKQTLDEAVETYHLMVRAYADCGYEVVEVPRVAVELRADFILKTCNLSP
jgi:predicted ATPase